MEQQKEESVLDGLLRMWHKDSKIDNTEPGKEILKISNLHAKYMVLFTNYTLNLRKSEQLLKSMTALRADYYNGRMTKEELEANGWEPYRLVILKQDLKDILDADEYVQKMQTAKHECEVLVDLCKSIIKQIEQRSYNLSAYIEWLKFSAGAR